MKNLNHSTLVFLFFILFIFAGIAKAADCRVTKTADTNDGVCDSADCSIREAVAAAACSTIDFAPELVGRTFTLSPAFGQITIGRSLSLTGYGADAITISGGTHSRIFFVADGGNQVSISGVSLINGWGQGTAPSDGGAVRCLSGCSFNGVHFSGNNTQLGSAVAFVGAGVHSIRNSTFSGNGLFNGSNGIVYIQPGSLTVQVTNSTFDEAAPAVYANSGNTLRVYNSTVVVSGGNRAAFRALDNSSVSVGNSILKAACPTEGGGPSLTSFGYNIFSNIIGCQINTQSTDRSNLDPLLGSLQYNGGHIRTKALSPESIAIDTGSNVLAANATLFTDQRGFERIWNGTVDRGAYEFNSPAPAPPVRIAGRIFGVVNGSPLRSVTVILDDLHGTPRTTLSSSFGWYIFDQVPGNAVYKVRVVARRGPQELTVFSDHDVENADIFMPGY